MILRRDRRRRQPLTLEQQLCEQYIGGELELPEFEYLLELALRRPRPARSWSEAVARSAANYAAGATALPSRPTPQHDNGGKSG